MLAIGWSSLKAGTALLAAAWLAASLMRRSPAAARHAVWVAGLCGMAFVALMAAAPEGFWGPAVEMTPAIKVLAVGAGAASRKSGMAGWVLAVWAAGTLLLWARLGWAHFRIALVARRAKRLRGEREGVRFVEAPRGYGPMVWGVIRPVVFLPREAEEWGPDVRDAVLRHELAHCARGDCGWLLLGRLIAGLFWFQPLAWLAVRRMRSESERAADDAVLRSGVRADDYAGLLVRLARSMRGDSMPALAMGEGTELEGRLKAVLDSGTNRRRLSRAGAFALAVAMCAALLPVAAAQKSKTDEKAYKIGGGVKAPSVISKVEPRYTQEARDAKLQGSVLLAVEINKQGVPENIRVLKGLELGLSESAVAAVKQWKFKPGMKDGKPVRVKANIEVNFRLN
jgi:TonB family protein